MTVEVTQVEITEKSVLRNLMELYAYDFSEIEGTDVNEHGLFGYRYFDHYWTEPDRLPFFIRDDGKLVGFVLLHRVGPRSLSVSEFFVMRAHRRSGVGRGAMKVLVEKFGGSWTFDVIEGNTTALAFWRSVVREGGGGDEAPHEEHGQRVTRLSLDVN